MEQAKNLHISAEQEREQGNFSKSLELTDQALVAYLAENNLAGAAEVTASRFLTLRHLHESTDQKAYLVIAKHTAEMSVELADLAGTPSAKVIPLYNLAKAQQTLGQYAVAVNTYRQVLELMAKNPPAEIDNAAVLADMKIHLGVCEYEAGDTEAVERVESAIERLSASDAPVYEKAVWLSGGHLALAEAMLEKNKDQAKTHLDEARKIIEENPDLTLRAKQLDKLAAKFSKD
jgi:tetratricopeptide (TPR) repeat protein